MALGKETGSGRRRVIKKRVAKKGTIISKEEDVTSAVKTPSKIVKKSKNLGKDVKSKKRVYASTDDLNGELYPLVLIDSDANKDGKAVFNIDNAGLTKIVNLLAPMSNKVEKTFIMQVTDKHLVVSQEQEGITAVGYIDVEFETIPKEPITFVFSKEAIKQLRDVTADFAQFKIYDSNLDIYIADTKLEMATEDTSEIPTIDINLDEYEDIEYMNADTVNNIFGRAKAISTSSAGTFEPTVSIGENISCGSEFYLTEIRDCFKTFNANCSPELILYILNLSKTAKKKLKFATTEDYILVMNDRGMIYRSHKVHIKFPTDISKEFLPSNDLLSQANFDSRVLMTSIQKLKIALLGTVDPEIKILFNPKRGKAEVSVSADSSKTSTDAWSAGDMDKSKIEAFKVLVSLLVNTISILDNNITMAVYDNFISISDDTQIIIIATSSND